MANRLANETSPYLLQHADNPVDWYPWGEEALSLARENDRPILLSIGYSACHWCHVMAHESFENPEIARMMNDLFVNIKVDREERPDLDALYMMAVQMLTGHGGWPMTVFLTPDGRPFYGGTYYPSEDRGVMPGFPRVLKGVSEAYHERKSEVNEAAEHLTGELDKHFNIDLPTTPLNASVIDQAAANLSSQFDSTNGGFGGAPKFPSPMSIELLFRHYVRTGDEHSLQMAELSLDKMARGGLYDQIGGGFHRYTVDAIWLVPHFEKMLYDNAQLAHIYTIAHQLAGTQYYRVIAEETLDYVLAEMTAPEGGFYSTQDADTEGEEGKFYVWTPSELKSVLGDDDGEAVATLLGATERGNFEGSNVLSIPKAGDRMEWRNERFAPLRSKLYEARTSRTWPGRDEKILTSWNGLMMRAFATAGWVFNDDRYMEAARTNARFLRENVYRDGRLFHTCKNGEARVNGFLEDYAYLVDGLVSLYQTTFEPEWISWAVELARTAVDEFYSAESGAFYDTGVSHESLISRPRDATDTATPAGNSVICDALIRLSHLIGDVEFERLASGVLSDYAGIASEHPQGFSRLLTAADFAIGPSGEIALIGEPDSADVQAMLERLRANYLPRIVLAVDQRAGEAAKTVELLRDRPAMDSKATAYVCVNHACQQPTTDPDEMLTQIRSLIG